MAVSDTLHASTTNEAIPNNHEISKFKNYTSQCYAAFATNLVKSSFGAFAAFSSILVAEFSKENAEIKMNDSELTWFSSRFFMAPVGCLVVAVVAQNIGNRLSLLIASLLYIVSCLIFHFATNTEVLLSVHALIGLIAATAVGPGNAYVAEIAQPRLRSALIASTTLSVVIAAFSIMLLSNFLHWRTLALIILVFPITGFIAVCTIPESPLWLASKQKFDKAEAALAWVRGWTTPKKIATEFHMLKEVHKESSFNSNDSTRDKISNFKRKSYLKSTLEPYLQRSFYLPLMAICCMFVLHDWTGYSIFYIYYVLIFRKMNSPIDPHVAASIFDGTRTVGAVICIVSVHYTGKKKLLCISLIGAAVSYFTASTVLLLKENQIYPDVCRWVATIAVICSTFFTSAGIDKVVFMLNSELFPTKFRNTGSGIGLFVSQLSAAISNKIFFIVLNAVTLSGLFIIFGIVCIVSSIIFHFIFPETEKRTLKEIEDHYEGVNRLKN